MTGDNALGLRQAVHLAVEGGQAHALGFLDVIPDPAGRAEALSLKGLAQGAVVGELWRWGWQARRWALREAEMPALLDL